MSERVSTMARGGVDSGPDGTLRLPMAPDLSDGRPGTAEATRLSRGAIVPPAPSPIVFEVFGVPAPKGSMKAFVRPGSRFASITHDNTRTKPWTQEIVRAVLRLKQTPLWEGPISLTVSFQMPKPKSLPKRAFNYPTKKPDLDKLLRLTKDALKGIFYCDDAQVVESCVKKLYADVPSMIVSIAQLAPGREGEFTERHISQEAT